MKPLPAVAAAVVALACAPSLRAQVPAEQSVRSELGAANFVPADCAYFSSTLQLGEQWQTLRGSNVWRELTALPAVTLGLSAMFASPGWRRFEALRDESPQLDGAVELLGDALSHEVFVCLDKDWRPFLARASATYLEAMVANAVHGGAAVRPLLVDGLVELEVPTTLLGCRVGDPARARELLQFAVGELGAILSLAIEHRQIGAGDFHVLRLDAAMVPAEVRDQLRVALRAAGADDARVARFDRWLEARGLTISAGLRGNHLLFAIGADTGLLERLGNDGCLADAPALATARAVLRPGVLALQYVCPDLSARQPIARGLAARIVGLLAASGAPLPAGLLARFDADVHALFDELAAAYGPVRAEVAISFRNRGIESFVFLAEQPGRLDCRQPLSLLAHGGATPLLLAASRVPATLPDYVRFAHWLRVGYGYFTDYVVPGLGPADRRDHEKLRDTVLPFLARVDAITREDLLPSIDGRESLLVLDGAGSVDAIGGMQFGQPLRYPRPAIVQQLDDGRRFDRALQGYHAALDEVLGALTERRLRLPKLAGEQVDEVQRYALPAVAPGITPTALVANECMVLALADDAARALLVGTEAARTPVVDLGAPAGAVLHVDLAGLLTMVVDDVATITAALHAAGRFGDQQHDLLRAHLPRLRRALTALRSYSSRTWTENGLEVTHSWLQVEDIAK